MKASVNERIEKIERELNEMSKEETENSPIWNYLSKIEDRYTNHQTQITNSFDRSADLLTAQLNKLDTECTATKSKQGLLDNELNTIKHNVVGMKREIAELKKIIPTTSNVKESALNQSDTQNVIETPGVDPNISNNV